ncbi:MAG: hypothetical protein ACR2FJ_00075 [Qipengyuania sp.]
MNAPGEAGFARLARALTAKAEAIALARAQARLAARGREGSHWRSAPYLWPLFGAGG